MTVSTTPEGPEHAGDVHHPEHGEYLLELGRVTYAAARLSGIAFDVLRVHAGHDSVDMYNDPLGKLQKKLTEASPEIDGHAEFLNLLEAARQVRNDLIHALPVKHGLHRRDSRDPYRVVDFYSVSSLREARSTLERAWRLGSAVLYADGGVAVQRWYSEKLN